MQQATSDHRFCADHFVQFYRKSEYLAESVAEYIQLGLNNGDGIFILATREHWQSLMASLLRKDARIERHLKDKHLLYIDAHLALQKILDHGRLNKAAFIKFIESILEPMRNYPRVRAYGELVDLLCADGRIDEAIELENYWNEILRVTPHLSLMCGYKIDHVAEDIPSIEEVHSHMIQAENFSEWDDEEALYRRLAILEQRNAALKHNYQEKLHVENELSAIKKQLSQAGKLSILGELCAGIAHELNNPLAIIAGSIRNARELVTRSNEPVSPLVEELLKRLDYIEEASSRMTKIVRSVLLFARQQDQSLVNFDLRATLQKAIEFLQNSLRFEHIQLQLVLPMGDLLFMGDKDAILQAFVNIISNARDALASTPEGQERVLIISAQFLADQRLEISFRDNGIGMDEQTLGKVFYPFFTTKDIGKGTGLGLAISHGIIMKHKGQIFCESKPGLGTLVRVLLPQEAGTSEALRA